MGGLRQTSVRRTRTGAPLSGAVHPSSGDFQWAIARSAGRSRAFPLAGFTRQESDQGDVPRCGGIHPALPPPRWLCEDPAFRLSIQPQSARHGPAVPGTPAGPGSTASRHRAPTTGLPRLRCRTPSCDRTAIHGTLTPKRTTASNISDGFFVKMIAAISILRPRRSPTREDRRRVPPAAVWTHERPVAAPRTAESPHAAHAIAPQLAVTHAPAAGESSRTPESNPHRPAQLA